jgi:3' terminal RNA ribose 2'-O-methyltransferase Hen1
LTAETTVRRLLTHLYVLIPVLDNAKHYYVGVEEVDKLLRHGEGWLAAHPEKDLIARRYLVYKGGMVRAALEQLREDVAPDEEAQASEEERIEAPVRLNDARLSAALAAVRELNPPAKSVIDLGCGEGRLLKMLLNERGLERVVGVDVSSQVLARSERNLRLESMPERKRERIQLIQGSLVYRDDRFRGFDAALLVEVIEHIDPARLRAMEQVVFGHARARRVIVSTPNADYNASWPSLPAGKFRHRDHRFEWTRGQFREWAASVAESHGYSVSFVPVGPVSADIGPPTQMGIFDLDADA